MMLETSVQSQNFCRVKSILTSIDCILKRYILSISLHGAVAMPISKICSIS